METNTERVVNAVEHLQGAFGGDAFGRKAEAFARFFGTPKFLIGQSVLVVGWIIVNVMAVALRWDPYPFYFAQPGFLTPGGVRGALVAQQNVDGWAGFFNELGMLDGSSWNSRSHPSS